MKRSVKILLLEDNPSDVELLKYELKHSGMSFDIKVVDSREAYLNALKDFRPEVILSDHSLPSFNSIEALALARQKSMVPFILVTGTVSEEFAVSCMKAGATDYILKASLKRLPSAIENALTANEIKKEKAEVEELHRQLKDAFREIEDKNKSITDSITYARRIQDAMLPESSKLQKIFSEWFIYNQPKDIVSGDFYWFEKQGDNIVVAVADCTGHGVPGALMSVIGTGLLNKVVNERGIYHPDEVLRNMNYGLSRFFRESSTKDGMDLAVCCINIKDRTLKFAGANRPVWILSNGFIQEVAPTKSAIGGLKGENEFRQFILHNMHLNKDDIVYLFTDGILDQFGGLENKKLMKNRFREFLLTICDLPLEQQGGLFAEFVANWSGQNEQVDDILVVGIKL